MSVFWAAAAAGLEVGMQFGVEVDVQPLDLS
jgi:hypothetical protein